MWVGCETYPFAERTELEISRAPGGSTNPRSRRWSRRGDHLLRWPRPARVRIVHAGFDGCPCPVTGDRQSGPAGGRSSAERPSCSRSAMTSPARWKWMAKGCAPVPFGWAATGSSVSVPASVCRQARALCCVCVGSETRIAVVLARKRCPSALSSTVATTCDGPVSGRPR